MACIIIFLIAIGNLISRNISEVIEIAPTYQENFNNLLQKVVYTVDGSVKIHISRGGSGRYLPKSTHTNLFITTNTGSAYKKNTPISLCFYDKECKAIGSLQNIKSINSLVSVLASVHAHENNFDNAILFNNSGNITEVANANIFFVKNDNIYTPPLIEGCVDGTMRKWVCNEMEVCEKAILKNEILNADEVFCVGTAVVITPVGSITYKTQKFLFNNGKMGNHTIRLREKLIQIQKQEIKDPFGWICNLQDKF